MRAEITALAVKPGGSILVQGSPSLVHSLLRAGLLAELNLLVMSRIVGAGLRLFDGATPAARLTLNLPERDHLLARSAER